MHASSVKQGRPPRERLPRARVSFGIPAHLRTLLALTLGRSTSRESRWNGSVGGQTTVKKRFVESRNQLSVAEMCRTVSGGTYEQTTSLTSLTTSESTEPRELHAPPPTEPRSPDARTNPGFHGVCHVVLVQSTQVIAHLWLAVFVAPVVVSCVNRSLINRERTVHVAPPESPRWIRESYPSFGVL